MSAVTAAEAAEAADPGDKPLVRIIGLKKSYGTHRVLDGVDLDVAERSVTVLLGQPSIAHVWTALLHSCCTM